MQRFIFSFLLIGLNIYPADTIRIIFTSSLSGNLYSCMCGLKLSTGLAKRDTYLKQIGFDQAKDILLDTGSSLDASGISEEKAKAIYESFSVIGYNSINAAGTDFQTNSIDTLKSKKYPINSSNIILKGFFTNKSIGKQIVFLNRQQKEFAIINISSLSGLGILDSEVKSGIKLIDPQTLIHSIYDSVKDKNVILVWNGKIEEAKLIADKYPSWIVIAGTDKEKPAGKAYTLTEKNKVFHSGDTIGDMVGIIELTETAGKLEIKDSSLTLTDVDKLKDSDRIVNIIKKYNIPINGLGR